MQGELFNLSLPNKDSQTRRRGAGWFDRFELKLRFDHLSLATILALVLYVLVFSFGVEKGKTIALEEIKLQQRPEVAVPEPGFVEAKPPAPTPGEEVAPSSEPIIPQEVMTPPSGKYTIQLIAYTSESRAKEEVRKLRGLGFESFIIPRGRFYQVCVNRFQKVSEAQTQLIQLKTQGFAPPDAYIRPVAGSSLV